MEFDLFFETVRNYPWETGIVGGITSAFSALAGCLVRAWYNRVAIEKAVTPDDPIFSPLLRLLNEKTYKWHKHNETHYQSQDVPNIHVYLNHQKRTAVILDSDHDVDITSLLNKKQIKLVTDAAYALDARKYEAERDVQRQYAVNTFNSAGNRYN